MSSAADAHGKHRTRSRVERYLPMTDERVACRRFVETAGCHQPWPGIRQLPRAHGVARREIHRTQHHGFGIVCRQGHGALFEGFASQRYASDLRG